MISDIKKTPIPVKAKPAIDDLFARMSLSVGRPVVSDKPRLTPVPIKNKIERKADKVELEVDKVDRRRDRIEYRERVSGPSCEICRSRGTSFYMARCGHGTWLCHICRRDCEAAMELCDKCDAKKTAKQLAAIEKACLEVH